MKTGIIYSKKSLNHDTGDGHPENKFRIQSILERLKKVDNSKLVWSEPKKFDEEVTPSDIELKLVDEPVRLKDNNDNNNNN